MRSSPGTIERLDGELDLVVDRRVPSISILANKSNHRPMDPERAARWNALLDAAADFHRLAPWRWLDDTQVFGVRAPVGDDIGWCVVIGRLGQNLGLVLYLGDHGWRSFRDMQEGWPTPEDAGMDQRCLSVTFDERSRLSPAMRALLKTLGRRHLGSRAWPDALDANPGYIPDLITDEDLPWMTRALRKAVEVGLMTRERPGGLAVDQDGCLLVAEREMDGAEHWARHAPPEHRREDPRPFRFDLPRAVAIARSAQRLDADWLVDRVRPFPVVIPERGTRPSFPHVLLIYDIDREFIVACRVLNDLEHDLGDELLACAAQGVPRRFLVRRREFVIRLAPIAAALGVAIECIPELEAVTRDVIDRMRQARP